MSSYFLYNLIYIAFKLGTTSQPTCRQTSCVLILRKVSFVLWLLDDIWNTYNEHPTLLLQCHCFHKHCNYYQSDVSELPYFVAGSPNSGSLKWVRVNVPQYRIPGEMAQLQCDYDLGNDTLYAIKWYKDHEEFYRFVPKATPQMNSYKLEGVQVDVSSSFIT